MTVKMKAFSSMTPEEKKRVSSMRRITKAKPKMADAPPVFRDADTIYFAKRDSGVKCHVCNQEIKEGEQYRVSTSSRHFKHAGCGLEQVKQ
jgi:hypothetical protein